MKETKQERSSNSHSLSPIKNGGEGKSQRGNAMIYVLVVIALFAALTFILSRQSDTTEAGGMSAQQADIAATQIIETSMQVKQALDSMMFGGTAVAGLDFVLPSDAAYDTPPNKDKVFHPDGGGVILTRLPNGAALDGVTDPAPGWYLGRFNTVDWTPGSGQDVILSAYGIAKAVCERINEKLTGSRTIPVSSAALRNVMVDDAHHNGSNAAFTAATCAGCDGHPSLCVEDPANDKWGFYAIVEAQ